MTTFLTDLFSSIFTPGPSPSLLIATNVSFAALQIVLIALLAATHSVHFVILSFLSAFLWYAINWFVRELEIATANEEEQEKLRRARKAKETSEREEDSGEETEGADEKDEDSRSERSKDVEAEGFLKTEESQENLRKRRSTGEQSFGELSTDSEWDKVGDSEEEIAGKSSQEE